MEQGKSQLRVAELLCAASGLATITRHEISRWEREERIPGGMWLRWLAVVLDTPLDDLERAAAVARERREMTMTTAGALERVPAPTAERRGAEAGAAAGVGAAGVGAAGGPGPEGRSRLWPAEREARRVRLRELRRMDDLVAGPELAAVVHGELRAWVADPQLAGPRLDAGPEQSEASTVVQSGTGGPGLGGSGVDVAATIESRTAREQLTLIASLAQLAGWVAADAGASDAALAAFRLGLRAAERGGDRPVAGHLLGGLAQLTAEDGDPRAAMRLARSAQRRAGATASSGVRSLLALRLAYAAAVGGLRRECEEALAVAERAAAQRDPRLDPEWLYWFDDAHFSALAGRCQAVLARPAAARPLLEAALRTKRVRFRAAGITGAALATVRLDMGDVDAAGAAATDALLACVQSGSMRAASALRAFDRRLGSAAPAGRRPAAVREYARLADECRIYLPTMRAGPISLRVAPRSPADQDRHTSILQDARREPRRAGGSRPG
jgi:hypothetical protein